MFTFQDVPGVPVWCRETWTRTLIYTGLGRNPYRLPVIVNALVDAIFCMNYTTLLIIYQYTMFFQPNLS